MLGLLPPCRPRSLAPLRCAIFLQLWLADSILKCHRLGGDETIQNRVKLPFIELGFVGHGGILVLRPASMGAVGCRYAADETGVGSQASGTDTRLSKAASCLQSLVAILTHSEKSGDPATGWVEALKLLRETPDYRKLCEQHEPQILEFERTADLHEIELLLATMPSTRIPH